MNYNIKRTESGTQICKFVMEWVDEAGSPHKVETDDVELAKTIIDLLSGEICLADLEP